MEGGKFRAQCLSWEVAVWTKRETILSKGRDKRERESRINKSVCGWDKPCMYDRKGDECPHLDHGWKVSETKMALGDWEKIGATHSKNRCCGISGGRGLTEAASSACRRWGARLGIDKNWGVDTFLPAIAC